MAKAWSKELYVDGAKGIGIDIVNELCENLREQDKIDLEALGHDTAFGIIMSMRLDEETWLYRNDKGELLCILGVGKPNPGVPGRNIWMVGTDKLYDGYVRELLFKEAQYMITKWLICYGLLYNAVYEKNTRSINYMKRVLGAVFIPEDIVNGDKVFKQFYIGR